MTIKEVLYNHCLKFIEQRYFSVQKTMNEIAESLTAETKSSAGDKHETGRAMLQLEREKTGKQLLEINKTKEVLSKLNITSRHELIGLGSIVYTSEANYFIAISAGKIDVDKEHFYAISSSTPIGRLLLGKKANDKISFRDQTFKIIKVL